MQQWDEHTHAPRTWEEYLDRAIEMAVERAIFGGNEIARRRFLQLVGASSAAAIMRMVFPLDTTKALAQDHDIGVYRPRLCSTRGTKIILYWRPGPKTCSLRLTVCTARSQADVRRPIYA